MVQNRKGLLQNKWGLLLHRLCLWPQQETVRYEAMFLGVRSFRLWSFGNHCFPILCLLILEQPQLSVSFALINWEHVRRWHYNATQPVASPWRETKIDVQPLVIPMRLGGLKYGRSSMVHYQVVRSPSKNKYEGLPFHENMYWHVQVTSIFRYSIWVFTPKVFSLCVTGKYVLDDWSYIVFEGNVCVTWISLWNYSKSWLRNCLCSQPKKKHFKWVIVQPLYQCV